MLWAPAWPVAGLLILAAPLRFTLARGASRCPKLTCIFLVIPALVVVAGGTYVLSRSVSSGLHYASRCPMPRATGRCKVDSCPPACRRESEFSPCVCGHLEEAEMARSLFLHSFPACQPYEWYALQMRRLEDLMLQYENFACAAGPLMCIAVVVGAALLLAQLSAIPLILLGMCGAHHAILILLASEEDLDRAIIGEPLDKLSSEKGTGHDKPRPGQEQLPQLPKEPSVPSTTANSKPDAVDAQKRSLRSAAAPSMTAAACRKSAADERPVSVTS